MRITARSCFAANNCARAQLSHRFRAQTRTPASKPLKCGTSAIFDQKILKKKVWIFLLNVVLFGKSVDVFVLKQLIISESGIYQFCIFCVPSASANNWSARHWQITIFCSTSSNNCLICYVLRYVVMRCLQHVSLNDATQKNLSLSANINIRRIAWLSCFKQ